ncbi:MAG: ATP-binding protein [Anaerolineae bacterium]|nr:ATP-binding protein [Anaerolineae bacterium]NUQ03962.1 HAMP domain-containing protein [Anaerolineae bacterium]
MRWFKDLSVGFKIQIIVLLAIAVPALIVLALIVINSDATVRELGRSRIEQETLLLQENLVHIQEDIIAAADLFKNTPGLQDAVIDQNLGALRTLAYAAAASLEVDDFDIFDAQGIRLLDTLESGIDDAENDLITQTLMGVQRSSVYTELQEDGLALRNVVTRILRGPDGATVGGLLLTRDISSEFLNELNFGRDGVELSVIYDGELMVSSFAPGMGGSAQAISVEFANPPEFLASAMSGTAAINPENVSSSNGTIYAEGYIPIQGLDDNRPSAVLAVRVNLQTISDFQRTLVNSTVVFIILLTVLFLSLTRLLTRWFITQPIFRLQRNAARLTEGNYAERIAISSRDEIGKLGEALNQLAGAVQQREGDLKQINETLERRVRERTREADGARRLAEENNRLKSEFLATMSHELRTPLNAIEGFTSIIRNRMGGADFNEKTGCYIERIEANSKRLLGLVNDFLDISRIESGRLQLASLPFSPADAAQKWASQIGVLADKKGIAFDLTLDPALPDRIVGDEEAVSKMALNLLSNAIKFTEQGKVSLDVRATGSGGWQITVRDTGIGIPPHAREYIFDEFRQADQTSSRKYGGTGLGLTIVQKLARDGRLGGGRKRSRAGQHLHAHPPL